CWLGKNIGGTMGTPYEGAQQLNHITGYNSPKGEPLPNDDLDLQLVWLDAVERFGIEAINERLLGEWWLRFVTPHWNEYGIGKVNMRAGLLPPLSGEYRNPWKHSNGAWIRTEIWAGLMPAAPNTAVRYAYYDASVDHGMGEGTLAAIFVEAMESAAYVIDDLNTLIEIGLSKIPEDCYVARSVRKAMECYASGMPWEEAREQVRLVSEELGWFMAPANVGYVIIGLLYGEGDFKKSMCIAIGCGDDTDCTGATLGSLLGIMHGTAIIPKDWQEYIGDNIVTISINMGDNWKLRPLKTCTQLTDRVMAAAQEAARRGGVIIHDGPNAWDEEDLAAFRGRDFVDSMLKVSPYSYRGTYEASSWLLELDREPDIAPGQSINVKITMFNVVSIQQSYRVRWILPEGWQVEGAKHFTTYTNPTLRYNRDSTPDTYREAYAEFTITAPENVEPLNRLVAEVVQNGHPNVAYIPVVLLG
ncbi:MAG: ADP-ribosylglycohydrolase family protein, partial [Clostridia bacterium]|nr:ADP-ribosylglycohydrolase family protein [Clostridia bacterium]